MTEEKHQFLLHACKDGHYHIITEPENISWPFWSREAGIRLTEFCKTLPAVKNTTPKERKRQCAEFDRMKREIDARSRIQNRDEQGRFQGGFVMRKSLQSHERMIATAWGEFRRGEVPYMCYIVESLVGTFVFPLCCDFIGRKDGTHEALKDGLDRAKLAALAEAPARIITMQELGIVLEPDA